MIVSLVCFCLLGLAFGAKDLPSYFPRCYRDDPGLNKCLLDATEEVKKYMSVGVPELNVPPLEPFEIPAVTLQQGTQALNFKADLYNITVKGLSNYNFSQFDFDVPNLEFFCKATIKPLEIIGSYKVKGRLLVAPIEGEGQFSAKIDSADVDVYQKVQIIKKKGLDYISPVETRTKIKVAGPRAHLDGLFGGNEELNSVTNRIINDNVDVLFEEIKPILENIIKDLLEDFLLKAFESQIPYDKLYAKLP